MKKKQFTLILSSLLIAGFAFACTPKTPEDRIIKITDTIYNKVKDAKDCDKLAADLESYCKGIDHKQFAADFKKLMMEGMAASLKNNNEEKSTPAMEKIEASMNKFDELEETACAKHEKVGAAIDLCLEGMVPDFTDEEIKGML